MGKLNVALHSTVTLEHAAEARELLNVLARAILFEGGGVAGVPGA